MYKAGERHRMFEELKENYNQNIGNKKETDISD